jgi:hypothetical protein
MFNCFDCFLCSLIGLIVYGPLVIKFPVFLPSSPELALLPGSAQAQAQQNLLPYICWPTHKKTIFNLFTGGRQPEKKMTNMEFGENKQN